MFTQNVLIFIYILVISGVRCAIDDAIKREMFNIYKGIAVEVKEITHTQVTPDEITCTYFDKNQTQNGTVVTSSNLDIIKLTSDQIIFILHGWTSSGNTEWVVELKNAFLTSHPDCSVIIVDWEKPAGQIYAISSINTYDVGNYIGDMINDLIDKYNIDINKFLLVGHSLGSQACGFAGKKLKSAGKLLPRIIALDPAGPLFSTRPKDKQLNPEDAVVVEVLHTDTAGFGITSSCGTIDFYANGGQFQPGCARIDLFDILNVDPIMCNHRRAQKYFIEAILNPTDFMAKNCSEYGVLKKKCDENIKVALGNLKTTARGNFYFDTNKEPPYAKRENSNGGLLGLASKLFKQ